MGSYQSFTLIMERGAPSHCMYDVPHSPPAEPPERMSATLLQKVLLHAQKNLCHLNLIMKEPLPPEYMQLLSGSGVSHQCIYPAAVEKDEAVHTGTLEEVMAGCTPERSFTNIVVRVQRRDIPKLAQSLLHIFQRTYRVNLLFRDLSSFTAKDVLAYATQLSDFTSMLADGMVDGVIELNALTDRLFLTTHNNCEAGASHLTISPDGMVHVCPAFYYEFPERTLGTFPEFDATRSALFAREASPVCSICDAYQCRRCPWLNVKATAEYHIPPREQCVVAHTERNASRDIVEQQLFPHVRLDPIRAIPYLDPFDIMPEGSRAMSTDERIEHVISVLGAPLAELTATEVLRLAYRVDPHILHKMKRLRGPRHE